MIPTLDTIRSVIRFCRGNGIIPNDFYKNPHCTIIYSPKIIPVDTIVVPQYPLPIRGENSELCIFTDKDGRRFLVIQFDSSALTDMHYKLRMRYGIRPDYTYRPHITLSKDFKGTLGNTRVRLKPQFIKLYMDNGPFGPKRR